MKGGWFVKNILRTESHARDIKLKVRRVRQVVILSWRTRRKTVLPVMRQVSQGVWGRERTIRLTINDM